MKLLITGGNGNIAKMIKNRLSNEFDIACISRHDFDMLNSLMVEKYLLENKFDVLIHTAIKGGRRTKEESDDSVYQNLLMFENLIKFAHNFKLIVNFDSGAIYDRATDIYCRKEEELLTIPNDYYGFSKYLIYKRTLQYDNVINFRIFNIFHANEEPDRFVKSCFLAKKNGTNVTIFQDKYFDFMYEDDFIKIVKFYIENYSDKLPKTFNLSYSTKYKLSDIAKIIMGKSEQIIINDNVCSNNYCGDGSLIQNFNLDLDEMESSLIKYETIFS